MKKTKKQKLERILAKAINQDNGNRIRNIVGLMADKAQKYGRIGNLYLKKLMKDDNKCVAGAANSAYMLIILDTNKIKSLEYAGIGSVKKKLIFRKIKEFEQEVSYPIEANGEIVVRGEDKKTFYDWHTERKIKEFNQEVDYPSVNKNRTRIIVGDLQNCNKFYDWETGKIARKPNKIDGGFSTRFFGNSLAKRDPNKKSFYAPFLNKKLIINLGEIKK